MNVSELIELLRNMPSDAVVMFVQDSQSESDAELVRCAYLAQGEWTYERGESKGRPYESWYPGEPHRELRCDCERVVYEPASVVFLTCSDAVPAPSLMPTSGWSIAMQRIDALYDLPQFVASTLVRKISANNFQLSATISEQFASLPDDVIDSIERIVVASYVEAGMDIPTSIRTTAFSEATMATLFYKQLNPLIFQRGIIVEDLAKRADMTPDQLNETLRSEHDVASSTLNSLATALDSEWVLVPKEHLTTVRRLLEGSGAVPDFAALSAAELYLATQTGSHGCVDEKKAAFHDVPAHRQSNQNDKKAKLDSETSPPADLVKSGALISKKRLRKQLGISGPQLEALVSDGSIFALDIDGQKCFPAILCSSALCLDRLWKIAKVIVPAPPAMRLDFLTQACAALEDRAPVDLLDDDRDYKQLRAYAKGWASEFSRTAVVVWDADTREELSLAKPIYTCSAALDPRRPLWRRALIAIRAPSYTQPVEAPPALESMVIVVERTMAGQGGAVPEAGFVCHLRGRVLRMTVHASDGAEISHEMKLTTKQPTVVDVADALFTVLAKVNRRADLATGKVPTKKGQVAGLKKTSSRRRHKG